MSDKVGFVGLGIMGYPMAKNLLKAGCCLLVNDIDHQAVARLALEGARAANIGQIGRECDIIFLMLPDGKIVQEVLLGEGGILPGLRAGTLVVDMSSITPIEAQACAYALEMEQGAYLDAPVSGGESGAVNAELAFMVGGTQEAFERAKPYFDIMGKSAELVGSTGCGCVTKLANQMIVNLTIAAVAEDFVLASKAGVDAEKAYRAIRGGLAGSAVLDAKVPMMISHNFKPGGKISTNQKDIQNAVDTAYALDVPVPLTGQLMEIMQVLGNHGHLGDGHSGIVQYYEQLAHTQVK